MKTVEIRRHAERDSQENLTTEGIAQCARARATMDFPYDAYVVSGARRAVLTMAEFGIPAPVVDRRLGPRPKPPFERFGALHEELMRGGMDACTAWYAIPDAVPLLEENGEEGAAAVEHLAAGLPDGARALAVSHGGTIEPLSLVLAGTTYPRLFGEAQLHYCEGVRILFDGALPVRLDVIRLR